MKDWRHTYLIFASHCQDSCGIIPLGMYLINFGQEEGRLEHLGSWPSVSQAPMMKALTQKGEKSPSSQYLNKNPSRFKHRKIFNDY